MLNMKHIIKFYPVGNADCTLIKLGNGKTIIIDCQVTDAYDKEGHQVCYDVKKDLLNELRRDSNNRPFVDLYVSTHPHDDHCIGFGDNFFHGDPCDYDDANNERIIIGEMWITPYTLKNDVCASAADIRREAKRRKAIYDSSDNYFGEYGNYLHIIGFDKDKNYDQRYGYVPGMLVKVVNGNPLSYLNIFVHAPFKEDVEKAKDEKDKNAVSIVMQLSFSTSKKKDVAMVLIGGDAEHQVWQHILENNKDDMRLAWDVFQAPHHCSWTFFNDTEDKEHVLPSAKNILAKRRDEDGMIVASSNEIKNEEPNPPHYEAKKEYVKSLKIKSNFLNTATHYVEKGIPQPIVLAVTDNGVHDGTVNINEEEAKSFSEALKSGALKVAKTGALSLTVGNKVSASGGFYGEK